MQEKSLLKISLICTLIGILFLFFLSEYVIKIDEVAIDKLDEVDIGKDVKIKGFIERITDLDKIALLEVSQLKSVTVVLFKSGNLTITEGDYVEITGEIDEYNGKIEVIGNEIKRLE